MTQGWLNKMVRIIGLMERTDNPYQCGKYFVGNDRSAAGFCWSYQYDSLFTIVKIDLVLKKDFHVVINEYLHYFSLRLDYAKHLAPGKILAFLENKQVSLNMDLRKGTRLAYTEVVYSPEFFNRQFNKSSVFSLPPEKILDGITADYLWTSGITQALKNIHDCELAGVAGELYYVGEVYKLMSALIEMSKERLPMKSKDFEEIQRVLHYIDQNYHGIIRQKELLDLVNMSPTKFKNLFHQFTGSSITDYILEKKTEAAIRMLSETDMSVDEIGRSLGFTTPSGFSASFKKRVGYSPRSYRKRIQYQLMDNETYYSEISH